MGVNFQKNILDLHMAFSHGQGQTQGHHGIARENPKPLVIFFNFLSYKNLDYLSYPAVPGLLDHTVYLFHEGWIHELFYASGYNITTVSYYNHL